jgi:flavin-dependent dehydrogenase
MTDVVVVGAGPAGSATATLLARRGRRVTLLDKARFPRPKPCAEYLSPGGVTLLEELGVDIGEGRRLRGMQVIAPNGARHVVEYGDGNTALSMQRTSLDARLLDVARAQGVRVCEGQRVERLVGEDGVVRGVLARGKEFRAACVVGADGLNSTVVRALRVRRTVVWPPRLGLIAHLNRVSASRPWAMARSRSGSCRICRADVSARRTRRSGRASSSLAS